MNILAIETSCDETALSIVEASGDFENAHFRVLGNRLLSQIDIHKEYGGVYPNLAKRAHAQNLIPLFEETLKEAEMYRCEGTAPANLPENPALKNILEREPELLEQFVRLFAVLEKPRIDAIAVTHGPGLEPALWVGINFARALAHEWNIPVIPINHMEGHIFSALLKAEKINSNQQETNSKQITNSKFKIQNIRFPLLALLISGGHTELVLSKEWLSYKIIGETRDDAVGEAFDKVARMMGLPYPGGPEISKLAEKARAQNKKTDEPLPRPMLSSDDYDFSFSGLKTAVLYRLKKMKGVSEKDRQELSREFEDAVTEILLRKTTGALEEFGAPTLIIGGGVSANKEIRRAFTEVIQQGFPDTTLLIPEPTLSTDNALMIAVAGFLRSLRGMPMTDTITANGNLSL